MSWSRFLVIILMHGLALVASAPAEADSPAPPPEHAALYAELSQNLTSFEDQLDASWNGEMGDSRFSATLSAANGNKAVALLSPNSWNGSLAMLDAYEA